MEVLADGGFHRGNRRFGGIDVVAVLEEPIGVIVSYYSCSMPFCLGCVVFNKNGAAPAYGVPEVIRPLGRVGDVRGKIRVFLVGFADREHQYRFLGTVGDEVQLLAVLDIFQEAVGTAPGEILPRGGRYAVAVVRLELSGVPALLADGEVTAVSQGDESVGDQAGAVELFGARKMPFALYIGASHMGKQLGDIAVPHLIDRLGTVFRGGVGCTRGGEGFDVDGDPVGIAVRGIIFRRKGEKRGGPGHGQQPCNENHAEQKSADTSSDQPHNQPPDATQNSRASSVVMIIIPYRNRKIHFTERFPCCIVDREIRRGK